MSQELNNTDKEILFKQYELYCKLKEGFTERNFATNKFYLTAIIVLLVIMFFTRDIAFAYNISANLIMAVLGVAISFFWLANADAYNIWTKVKLRHVIDEIEKQLPAAIHKMEMEGYRNYKNDNKLIVFTGAQKSIAIVMMIVFFVLFIIELVYFLIPIIYGPIQ